MAGERAEVVDEELAVEVVGLVLDRPAEELFGLVLDELALEVEGLDLDLLGAADLGVEPGQAEAAFLVLDRRVPLDDLGVDEDELLVLLLGVRGDVEDEEAIRDGHLVGRQADALRLVHQVEHLPDGRPQVVVDLGHGARPIAKGGMRISHDTKHESNSGPAKSNTPHSMHK